MFSIFVKMHESLNALNLDNGLPFCSFKVSINIVLAIFIHEYKDKNWIKSIDKGKFEEGHL